MYECLPCLTLDGFACGFITRDGALGDREITGIRYPAPDSAYEISVSEIFQFEIPGSARRHETKVRRAFLARKLGAVAFDGDFARDQRQAREVAVVVGLGVILGCGERDRFLCR